jgi:hypothetical protein
MRTMPSAKHARVHVLGVDPNFLGFRSPMLLQKRPPAQPARIARAPSDRARTARTAPSAAWYLSPVVQPAGYPRTTS